MTDALSGATDAVSDAVTGAVSGALAGPVVEATEPGDRSDPGQRGRLVVSQRAVEHLARNAATEVDGVVVQSGGLTGLTGQATPHVAVQLAGHRARIQVTITTVWPAVLAEVADGVRTHVRRRMDELAGVRADSVDVRISRMVRPHEHVGRRVE